MDAWLDDAPPPEAPEIDWSAVRRERQRRGWVHWTAGALPATEGGFAWIVMTHAATGDPRYEAHRATCGHLLDFDTARCAACDQPFQRAQYAGCGVGVVVRYLAQGEALYHKACAPAHWLQPLQPVVQEPTATQARLW